MPLVVGYMGYSHKWKICLTFYDPICGNPFLKVLLENAVQRSCYLQYQETAAKQGRENQSTIFQLILPVLYIYWLVCLLQRSHVTNHIWNGMKTQISSPLTTKQNFSPTDSQRTVSQCEIRAFPSCPIQTASCVNARSSFQIIQEPGKLMLSHFKVALTGENPPFPRVNYTPWIQCCSFCTSRTVGCLKKVTFIFVKHLLMRLKCFAKQEQWLQHAGIEYCASRKKRNTELTFSVPSCMNDA